MFEQITSIRNKVKEVYALIKSANKSLNDYGDGIITKGGKILTSNSIDEKFHNIDEELSALSTVKDLNKIRVVRVYRYKRNKRKDKWDKILLGQGVFHGYGVGYSDYDDKLRHFSSAIVEMANGEVKNVQSDRIEFVDPLLKKEKEEVKPELSEDEKDGIKKWAGAN